MKKLINALARLRDFMYFLFTGVWYFLKCVVGRVSKKTLKENAALITVVVLFFASAKVLRWLDPTAGVFDAGVLQVINLTLVKYAVYTMITWSSFKVLWPDLGHFLKYYFKDNFKLLTPWQKNCTSIFVYCFLLLVVVILSSSVV